jgi:uncharacterized protein (UPF0276 family)
MQALLDVNIHVNAVTHGFDADRYPRRFSPTPSPRSTSRIRRGVIRLIDTHGARVAPAVWAPTRARSSASTAADTIGGMSHTCVAVLEDEAAHAQSIPD